MNSKMLFMAFAMLLTMTLQAPKAAAEIKSDEDPKLNEYNDPQVTQGEALLVGIKCASGACYKDAHPKLGFEPEVLIEPSGTAGAPVKTKDGAITK